MLSVLHKKSPDEQIIRSTSYLSIYLLINIFFNFAANI